ncbi:MAG: hypothetical protein QM652_13600 [Legionella sp.]|uniref:hypothetical protein n=1 Tax=Legionella sp. TaxID=459 RepID=UPI0039E2FEFB
MINNVKKFLFNNYLINYIDVPEGTGKIISLVIIESIAMSMSYLISIYLVNLLHFTSLEVGKLISMLSLGACIGSLLSGYLTTRISVIKVSSFGLFMYAVGFFIIFCNVLFLFINNTIFMWN